MTFSPFFFFFFLFHISLFLGFSLFPSLSPSQPIRLGSPFATSQHRTHSQHPNTEPIRNDPFCQTHSRRSPFTTISPNRSPSPPNRSSYSSLLLAHHHFCSPSSHLLAVVTFARRRRFCLLVITKACSSSLKLDCRRRSNPSNISAPSHTDSSASFRRFNSHCPSTSTHTDCSTSLRRFKPQRPFGFHFNR